MPAITDAQRRPRVGDRVTVNTPAIPEYHEQPGTVRALGQGDDKGQYWVEFDRDHNPKDRSRTDTHLFPAAELTLEAATDAGRAVLAERGDTK